MLSISAAIAVGAFQKFYRGVAFASAFILGFLVCSVGFGGLWGFTGHFFLPDKVAQGIGWPTGSPFQQEIAFTNLGIGILGILCIWLRGNFWTATVIMNATFLMGAGYVHIKDIIEKSNMSPLNSGMILYSDFLIPIITIILLIMKHIQEKPDAKNIER